MNGILLNQKQDVNVNITKDNNAGNKKADIVNILTVGTRDPNNKAYGNNSFTAGENNIAAGNTSISIGTNNSNRNNNTILLGQNLQSMYNNQIILGQYNSSPGVNDIVIIGDGVGNGTGRSNIVTISRDDVRIQGRLNVQSINCIELNKKITEAKNNYKNEIHDFKTTAAVKKIKDWNIDNMVYSQDLPAKPAFLNNNDSTAIIYIDVFGELSTLFPDNQFFSTASDISIGSSCTTFSQEIIRTQLPESIFFDDTIKSSINASFEFLNRYPEGDAIEQPQELYTKTINRTLWYYNYSADGGPCITFDNDSGGTSLGEVEFTYSFSWEPQPGYFSFSVSINYDKILNTQIIENTIGVSSQKLTVVDALNLLFSKIAKLEGVQ